MDSHIDDEPQVVHMLALDSDGEAHYEEIAMLDHNEELQLMHAIESMGSSGVFPDAPDIAPLFVVPPPPPDMDPLFIGAPGMNDSLMEDSFIFGSEEDIEATETRNENLDIPVISVESSTSEPDEPVERGKLSPLPEITRTSSRQSSAGIVAHKEDDLLLEGSLTSSRSNSGRSREPSPAVSDRKSSQSVADHQRMPLTASLSSQEESTRLYVEPNRRNSDTTPPPIIKVLPSSDNTSAVIMKTPPAYQEQRPCESAKVIGEKTASRSSKGLVWGMSRPVFFILAFYLLFVTVAFAYFVAQYLESSSLSEEVDDLVEQNENLQKVIQSGEMLSVENEKLKESKLALQQKCETLSGLVAELQNQTDLLQAAVGNLTVENEELKETVLALQQVEEADANLTESLNETNAELAELVESLNATNIELEESNRALTNQTDLLQDQLSTLLDEVARLEEENSQLENLTESLSTIDSFLDESSQGADLSYQELMDQLEEKITEDRRLVLAQLENTLLQRTQLWSCDFRNAFSGATFVQSFNEPIGSASYESVMTYVENRVFTDLCLDRTNVESYLTVTYAQNGVTPPVEITSNQLIEGVSNYSSDVLNYYFPTEEVTIGLTPQDWAEASYTCVNLPADKQFTL